MEMQRQLKFNIEKIITRSPTLESVIMVEKFVKQYSGEYQKTALFHSLPKKMMWGTFNVILKYLWDNNKIGIDKKGYIVYIWNPELAKRFINRKEY